MNIAGAQEAIAAYVASEPGEYAAGDLDIQVSDLVSDLLHIIRETAGQPDPALIIQRAEINLAAEPASASDLEQLAQLHEAQGHTSMAAKYYEQAEDLR